MSTSEIPYHNSFQFFLRANLVLQLSRLFPSSPPPPLITLFISFTLLCMMLWAFIYNCIFSILRFFQISSLLLVCFRVFTHSNCSCDSHIKNLIMYIFVVWFLSCLKSTLRLSLMYSNYILELWTLGKWVNTVCLFMITLLTTPFPFSPFSFVEFELSPVRCQVSEVKNVACGADFTVWLTSVEGASILYGFWIFFSSYFLWHSNIYIYIHT